MAAIKRWQLVANKTKSWTLSMAAIMAAGRTKKTTSKTILPEDSM
jgi:hypothetical protein